MNFDFKIKKQYLIEAFLSYFIFTHIFSVDSDIQILLTYDHWMKPHFQEIFKSQNFKFTSLFESRLLKINLIFRLVIFQLDIYFNSFAHKFSLIGYFLFSFHNHCYNSKHSKYQFLLSGLIILIIVVIKTFLVY